MAETFSSTRREVPAADIAVTEENLRVLRHTSQRNAIKRMAHLREMLLVMIRGIGRSRLREMILSNFGSDEWYEIFSAQAPDFTLQKRGTEDLADAVFFCREVSRELWGDLPEQTVISQLLAELHGQNLSEPFAVSPTVACVQSRLTDQVLSAVFSPEVRVRTRYHGSFRDACEEVAAAQADIALLPIENESNGFLNSFFSLLERYELKIIAAAECGNASESPVGYEKEKWNRFLFLCREYVVHPSMRASEPSSYVLDLILPFRSQVPVASILGAAQMCSLKIRRIDGIGAVLRGMHYVSLYAAEQTIDTLTFLVFLLLFVPQFDVLGIYPNFVKELE